ncbi:hypothetical protein JNW91_25685 [Micromonospora sp. STR1_7]|uniref:Uncharacterized protein n=1 Tax=Micromonospora parastrephiae TaxID=2806101 RepID=A0ABS1Y085_9ACTN|nr:hypothetical protein [Micromonospora parastrephiae]MBM0234902.1 hypothetical protein [Micromonospora parastrephiae]
MLDERQIGDLMLAEIESAETPSRVLDVEGAMSTARRQRRAARGTGAVLLAAALTMGALTVPDLLNPERPPATGSPGDAGKEAVTGLPAALTTVDPGRVYVRFGWLPDGVRDLQYQAGLLLAGPGVYLGATSSRRGDPWQGVSVALYPQGVEPPAPQRDSGRPATVIGTSNGPLLNGGASSFVAYAGAEAPEVVLRWRYAPGGWVQLRLVGPAAATTDNAVRVARSLRFGDDPVPLPGKAVGIPAGLRLIAVDVAESLEEPGHWQTSTRWSPEPVSAEPGRQRARTLSVSISRYRQVTDPFDKAYANPNTTVDGHPATFGGSRGDEALTVYDVNGATVAIDDDALLSSGGTRALFHAVTLVPDPSAWHTHLRR